MTLQGIFFESCVVRDDFTLESLRQRGRERQRERCKTMDY